MLKYYKCRFLDFILKYNFFENSSEVQDTITDREAYKHSGR